MSDKDLGAQSAAAVESAGSIAADAAPHAAHTPGPWLLTDDKRMVYALHRDPRWHQGQRGPELVNRFSASIEAYVFQGGTNDEADANAHLIAAAPEMKDAAEMLWVVLANVSGGDWSKQSPDWQEAAARWRDNYFAALAKSQGKQFGNATPSLSEASGSVPSAAPEHAKAEGRS